MTPKDAAKRAVYNTGLLPTFHRRRNARSLTVVMFHRVLAPNDPRWAGASPTHTLSDTLFDQCLAFFRAHYNVVDLPAVLKARRGAGCLPACPLLITFDDGWADNAQYALDSLRKHQLGALVFVVSSAVGSHSPFWHEILLSSWRSGALGPREFRTLWELTTDRPSPISESVRDEEEVRALIERLKTVDESIRNRRIRELCGFVESGPAHMLSRHQLHELLTHSVSIGCHGRTHTSVPELPDAASELRSAREDLARMLDDVPVAISFPNGRYTPASIRAARSAGFDLMFTSDAWLNPFAADGRCSDVLGRIEVPAHEISGPDGQLRPELLALWLFTRPSAAPPTSNGSSIDERQSFSQ